MTIPTTDLGARFALDAQSVEALRTQAARDPDGALKAASRQFEALFMNMMLKSMREATPQDGLFDSEQTRLYTSLLDQQLSQTLSGRGMGLADVMARQLSPGRPAIDGAAAPASAPASTRPGRTSARQSVRDFVSAHAPSAQAASQATGIPQRFLLAQAALESGWGRREIRGADGAASHNLFGIKAGADWAGRVVEAPTTEYVNGKAVKTVARFRAYDSDAESFADYAKLIAGSARYASVRGARDEASFAYGLQRAGYATDPQYADKVMRVISGIAASGVRTA